MLVRKRRKAAKPIADVKVTDQPWRIIFSLYKTLMSKTFPQESSEAFFKLKKSALRRTKNTTKTSPACSNRVLWKALRKKYMVLFGFSKKKLFGTLPPLLNKPMGFMTRLLEKQFKDSHLPSTPNLSLQRLRAAASLVHAHFLLNWV